MASWEEFMNLEEVLIGLTEGEYLMMVNNVEPAKSIPGELKKPMNLVPVLVPRA